MNNYNLTEYIKDFPEARVMIKVHVGGCPALRGLTPKGYVIPEGFSIQNATLHHNLDLDDPSLEIMMGHKMYVIHREGCIFEAISLNSFQFRKPDVIEWFLKDYEGTVYIDAHDDALMPYVTGEIDHTADWSRAFKVESIK